MFMDCAIQSAAVGEYRFAPSLCQRTKSVIAAAIGTRLRDVFPLRHDGDEFADLLAALELVPGRSIQ